MPSAATPLALATLGALCSAAHAQWSVVILHPSGSHDSRIGGGKPGMIVGFSENVGNVTTAAVWAGTDHTLTILDQPLGGSVHDTNGLGCVGTTKTETYGLSHATWWSAPAALMVDLHPTDLIPYYASNESAALAVDGELQAGYVKFAGHEHASIWHGAAASWVDIHPAGKFSSRISGAAGGQQVGDARTTSNALTQHAGFWHGTPESWIDLHASASASVALGTDGVHQVGYSYDTITYRHASLWSGTAASYIDLHPSADGSSRSQANAVSGPYQVGSVAAACCIDRAALWTGTAASWVDLGNFLPGSFVSNSEATAVWIDGDFLYIGGIAYETVVQGPGVVVAEPRAVLWLKDLRPVQCGPADIGSAGGLSGRDGVLNNNDFIAFIGAFFAGDPVADCGRVGGVTGGDGQFDNNDFIAFINLFFAGC